jgi:phospholipase C
MRQASEWKKKLAITFGLSTLMAIFAACGQGPRDLRAIQHVVFIVKENRTFDHYFGTFPGVDGAITGIASSGRLVPLTHPDDLSQLDNLCNSWDCALEAVDGGKMDKFDLITGGSLNAYTQFSEQDIPNYWAYPTPFCRGSI